MTTIDRKTIAGETASDAASGTSRLPPWFPEWAAKMAQLYFSGTTSMFVVHGNTFDYVQQSGEAPPRYGTLAEFLAEQLFGRWDLVLHYDLARGLRCLAGRSPERLKEMVALANKRVGDLTALAKDPSTALTVLDRFVRRNIMAEEDHKLRVAVVIDHASYVVPRGEPGRMSLPTSTHLVTLLNWASSPYVKRLNMAFVLLDIRLADLSERLASNPHVASIEVPINRAVHTEHGESTNSHTENRNHHILEPHEVSDRQLQHQKQTHPPPSTRGTSRCCASRRSAKSNRSSNSDIRSSTYRTLSNRS